MRNLRLSESLRVADSSELTGTRVLCVDYDTKMVYCATSTGILGLDPASQQVSLNINLTEDFYLPVDGSGRIVALEHLPDQMSVCVATATGDLLLCNTTTSQVECVGTVNSGLVAMAWSPDQELVVLATGQDTLIMMTREFDPVTEVPTNPSEFGEGEFITVGWGKKQTQFHGAAGKQAAMEKAQAVKTTAASDDGKSHISWRGDGQFFVVGSISNRTGVRELRVWSREMALQSTSEAVDGLESPLAWRPSGNLIASSQAPGTQHHVVFYERNGLRHGEFALPFPANTIKVNDLVWNTDSTVLAVWLEQLPPGGGTESFIPKTYVQLWTTSNYHWYLKQNLDFPAEAGSQVAAILWDPEHAYRLHLVCTGGQYLQYTWSWATDHSSGGSTTVAVINGDKVLMTPFHSMVVPPPFCAYYLQTPCAVNQVAFAPPPQCGSLAVALSDGRVVIYSDAEGVSVQGVEGTVQLGVGGGGDGFSTPCSTPTSMAVCTVEGDLGDFRCPLKVTHLTWVCPQLILCTALNIMGHESVLYRLHVDLGTAQLTARDAVEVAGCVSCIASNPDTASVAIQLTDGTVLKYDVDSKRVVPWQTSCGQHLQFPRLCTQVAVTCIGGEEVVLGLTDRFHLFVNDIQVATNCTSFAVHEEYLLLTTHAHTCRCICRTTKVNVLPSLSDGKAHPFDESVRRVERGSRIVCVVPDDTKLILQMPRGNLETIHPRALVLSSVRKHLDRLDFGPAFEVMRKHRINMNLLHDHDPKAFLDNVHKLVDDLSSVGHINLFLTDLVEEDVTATMYTAAYNRQRSDKDASRSCSKVDTVCDAVRQSLDRADPDKYLLSILTAYVRKTSPELDTALKRINSLRGGATAGAAAGAVGADEALKYLVFLVDVNELYDVALGTYDFDLVLMVAEKSQKDPKEYLPFLNSLSQLAPEYQRYTIDKHLKRYGSALHHCSQAGKDHFGECLSLVQEHGLYAQALRLYASQSEEYKSWFSCWLANVLRCFNQRLGSVHLIHMQVLELVKEVAKVYGQYLTDRHREEEAGLIYAKAGEAGLALAAFEQALNWRQALCMAAIAGHTAEQVQQLSCRMAGRLRDQRRAREAACLLEQYAGDCEEAIVALIDGAEWEEALRLMYKHNRTDFIETNLKNALQESQSEYMTLIESSRSQYDKYRKRLGTVREEKERTRLELIEAGGDYNPADADLFSDTSSATGESVSSAQTSSTRYTGQSQSSKRSGRSAKTRRKAERKKWSLKEGSRHEDLALIEALSAICRQAEQWKGEVGELLKMLVMFNYDDQASRLQGQLDRFLAAILETIPEIWQPQQETGTPASACLGPDMTTNAVVQAMQQQRRPGSGSEVQLDAQLRVAPVINTDLKWKLHISDESDTPSSAR